MYSIDGDHITLTRGDTLLVWVEILRDEEPYTPQTGDSVRFALYSMPSDAPAYVYFE